MFEDAMEKVNITKKLKDFTEEEMNYICTHNWCENCVLAIIEKEKIICLRDKMLSKKTLAFPKWLEEYKKGDN